MQPFKTLIIKIESNLLLCSIKSGDILAKVLQELSLALRKQQLVLVGKSLSLKRVFINHKDVNKCSVC